jgi:hypothetical protein
MPALMAAVTILLTLAGQPPAASAAAGGADNIVVVTNTVDGSAASRTALQVAHDPAETVANQNLATARSTDCTACRTVSVAMQVVVVEGFPHDFEPANAAVASNGGCTSCQTYAFAFQYVVQPGRMVYLSGDAQQRIAALRAQVDAVAGSDLSYLDMGVQLRDLFTQFSSVVSQELQAAGLAGDGVATESSRALDEPVPARVGRDRPPPARPQPAPGMRACVPSSGSRPVLRIVCQRRRAPAAALKTDWMSTRYMSWR